MQTYGYSEFRIEYNTFELHFVHFRVLISQFHTKNVHLYYSHHSISTVLLQHVSALKGPSSGSIAETCSQPDQQNVCQM
jgi:hypothetical protein